MVNTEFLSSASLKYRDWSYSSSITKYNNLHSSREKKGLKAIAHFTTEIMKPLSKSIDYGRVT